MEQQQGQWLWSKNILAVCLYPLSLIFCVLVWLRRALYKVGYHQSFGTHVPLVVIGNISVGGTGKTPVLIAVLKLLQKNNYRVGILSRGYKSQAESNVTLLNHGEQNELVGDESNLVSELCACPMAVGADRVKAAQALEEAYDLDVIISDDGLQHYALRRDLEIVIHRQQALGNGWCLPAGPLREPRSRLAAADLLIDRDTGDVSEQLQTAWNLHDSQQRVEISSLAGQTFHAIAGIGFPKVFFAQLRDLGLELIEHYFPDHYEFSTLDLAFNDDLPLIMTHKDAVKIRYLCEKQSITRSMWVAELDLKLSSDVQYRLLNLIEPLINK